MWKLKTESIKPGIVKWSELCLATTPLTFGEVISLWRSSDEFRAFWCERLLEVPFRSYCWECPSLTRSSLGKAFECVFVESPLLASSSPDPKPFAAYFSPDDPAVVFESLGKDAQLIAPCPGSPTENFAHLATFMSNASLGQRAALWSVVGDALERFVADKPIWLSTAGLGVSWLHVRLDSRPKYYRHAPYKGVGSLG